MITYGKQIITYDKQVEKSVRRNKKFEWSKFNMDTINSMKQIVGSLKKKNGYMSDRCSYSLSWWGVGGERAGESDESRSLLWVALWERSVLRSVVRLYRHHLFSEKSQ